MGLGVGGCYGVLTGGDPFYAHFIEHNMFYERCIKWVAYIIIIEIISIWKSGTSLEIRSLNLRL